MPKKSYALQKGGPKEIEISWGFAWKNFTVKHNGEIIGTVANQRELKEGRQFMLKDGSSLSVKLKVGFGKAGLEVLRNGQPLPGSDMDPVQKIKIAFGLLLFIAGMNILVGLVLSTVDLNYLGLGFGIGYIIFGIVFGILAFLIKARSLAALWIAIVLLILDAVAGLAIQVTTHNNTTVAWVIIRVMILIYLFNAAKPIKELKKQSETGMQ
jgi:hypothetical protein